LTRALAALDPSTSPNLSSFADLRPLRFGKLRTCCRPLAAKGFLISSGNDRRGSGTVSGCGSGACRSGAATCRWSGSVGAQGEAEVAFVPELDLERHLRLQFRVVELRLRLAVAPFSNGPTTSDGSRPTVPTAPTVAGQSCALRSNTSRSSEVASSWGLPGREPRWPQWVCRVLCAGGRGLSDSGARGHTAETADLRRRRAGRPTVRPGARSGALGDQAPAGAWD